MNIITHIAEEGQEEFYFPFEINRKEELVVYCVSNKHLATDPVLHPAAPSNWGIIPGYQGVKLYFTPEKDDLIIIRHTGYCSQCRRVFQ